MSPAGSQEDMQTITAIVRGGLQSALHWDTAPSARRISTSSPGCGWSEDRWPGVGERGEKVGIAGRGKRGGGARVFLRLTLF